MANTTISPNMSLVIPTVSVDPGVDWANNLNASLQIIDGHNHAPGSGVQITPSGLNISSDLTMQVNNLTSVRTVRFSSQGAALNGIADIGCIYEVTGDLYYNDGSGNVVRITQSGSVAGSSGTITGLPSGTASAAFSAGTFTFQSATNTPATLSVGPIKIGAPVTGSKQVTLSATNTLPFSYALTLPNGLPTQLSVMGCDTSGNLSFLQANGTGAPVFDTGAFADFAGLSTGGGPRFKMYRQTGTITASSTGIFAVPGGASVVFGILGKTTVNGGSAFQMMCNLNAAGSNECYWQEFGGGSFSVVNSDPSHSNSFDLIVFFYS